MAYSKAWMEVRKGLQQAKHRHRQHTEEHLTDNNPQDMWSGIRTITSQEPPLSDTQNNFFACCDPPCSATTAGGAAPASPPAAAPGELHPEEDQPDKVSG